MAEIPSIVTADGRVPAFRLEEPAEASIPFVFCSPHSGRDYPSDFMSATRLRGASIRRSEDLFVDKLFACAPRQGAPLLAARFPRAFLDVNREPYELDARMFSSPLPSFVNSGSVRVAGGLGTIPRIVAENEEIYADKLALADALGRIERYYRPFHRALDELLSRTRKRFGMVILVDCHSMPSSVRTMPGGKRPDIVIGDRFGTSAAGRLVQIAGETMAGLGFDVARNKPYAGGFITESYGRPATGTHAIQVEINRGLYADEARFAQGRDFDAVAERLERFVERFAAEVAADYAWPTAAE